ncbi:MAG: DUF4392 domain-containing protein [Alphaproteobacteria bacterium]|nr:DUF4392 domain-containing protein [Alphaproteobacteria bacterium]
MTNHSALFDLIDRIVCLDVGGRGVSGLFEPARALVDGPLAYTAAKHLNGLEAGDSVFIVTGSLTRAGVSPDIAENDGPIGSAVLARALSKGFNAIPVIIVDASIRERVARMVEFAGLNVVSHEQAHTATSLPRFTGVAVMENGAIEDDAARAAAKALLSTYSPKAVIACERAGLSADGTYRNALGQDYSAGREKLDYIVEYAQDQDIPTIGIGDGGNEIGMGAVKAAVAEHIPHGEVLCAEMATDVLLPAGVSNWGCYAIAAALAILRNNPALAHTPEAERRLLDFSPSTGLVDGMSGMLDATADGMHPDVHASIVELLAQTVRKALT